MNQDEAVGTPELAALIPEMTRRNRSNAHGAQSAPTFDDILAHREEVFQICLGFSRNYDEAEDLAQDVYVRAFRSWKNLRNPFQARDWLFRIAKNACLDRRKMDRTRAFLLRFWTGTAAIKEEIRDDPATADGILRARLKSAIRGLPRKHREVFVLREYGHLTYEEIGKTLCLRMGTVMSRLNRARNRVTDLLREEKA